MASYIKVTRQQITALIEAVQKQDVEAVRSRISAGDKLEETDSYGQTALHWAAKNESLEIVDLLVQAGANLNARDGDGETPLQAAKRKGSHAIVDVLTQAAAERNRIKKKKKKKRVDLFQIIVSVFSIIGVLAALIVVPEFRRWIGLDPEGTQAVEIEDDKLAVFYDDDGSLDGTVALLYLLAHQDVAVQAATISYGEAHPEVYVQHIGRLLDDLGMNSIPLGAGPDAPLSKGNAFPDWIRELSNSFWNFALPNEDRIYLATNAPELMVRSIKQSNVPVTIFMSGPGTNLAQALRLDPNIRENIDSVYIMGGAVYVPGNIGNLLPNSPNGVAEWNIYADPQAAKEVFNSGLDIYLVPLDATDQVIINIEDTRLWRVGGKTASYAASLYDISFNEYGMEVTEIWDLLAAVVMVDPELCGFQSLSMDVITEDTSMAGKTVLVADGQPNVSVCLYPDPDLVRQSMIDVFSHSE